MRDLSKAIFYFRVSTRAQAERENTIDHYFSKAYKIGFKDDQIIYDIGSGAKADREGYLKLKELASLGLIEAIVLPDDLSRLTRDLMEFQVVKQLLLDTKVKLLNMSFREYKFETPEDNLQQNIVMSFSDYERRRNQFRSIAGHKYLREHGKAIRSIFPYIKENGVLYPNTAEYKRTSKSTWEIGKELIAAYIELGTANQAIKYMVDKYGEEVYGPKRWHDYSRSTTGFIHWLKSELIRGNIEYHAANLIAYGTHEPLINEEEIKQVDRLIEIGASVHGQKAKVVNIWKRIAVCECGRRMRVMCKTKTTKYGKYQYRWMVCSEGRTNNQTKIRKIRSGDYTPQCNHYHHYGLSIEKLKDASIDALVSKANDISDQIFKTPEKVIPKEVKLLQKQIRKYKLLAEEDSDLLPLLNKKQLQLNQLLQAEDNIDEEYLAYLRTHLKIFGKDKEFWLHSDQQKLMILFNDFFEKIVCREGVPEFHFKI